MPAFGPEQRSPSLGPWSGVTWACAARALLDLSVLVVLREERPEIVDFFLVLDAGECHFGAGNLRLRILDVFLELGLVPGDAGILVGVRVGITLSRAGLAAVEPVHLRANLVLGALADRMAGHAFVERGLAGRDILRQRGGRGCRGSDHDQRAQSEFFHGSALRGIWGKAATVPPPLWHGGIAVDKP